MSNAVPKKRKAPSRELTTSVSLGGLIGTVLEPIAIAHGIPPGVATALVTGITHWIQGHGRAETR